MKEKIKSIVIIIIIIVVVFGVYKLVDDIGYKKWKVASDNNASNTQDVDNEISNTSNETEGDKANNQNVKKITITDEEIINILIDAEPFENGEELSTEKKLSIVYKALSRGYIAEYSNRQAENNKIQYTAEEINGIVYSLFGVTLKENKSFGDAFIYDGEKYTLVKKEEKNTSMVAKNIEYDVAAGTGYINYDLYQKNGNNEEYKGSYAIGKNKENSVIKCKKEM